MTGSKRLTYQEMRDAPGNRPMQHTSNERVYCTRVRLNAGGYTRAGTYYGVDAPLWSVGCDTFDFEDIRATDRDSAIEKYLKGARIEYPTVSIVRRTTNTVEVIKRNEAYDR